MISLSDSRVQLLARRMGAWGAVFLLVERSGAEERGERYVVMKVWVVIWAAVWEDGYIWEMFRRACF